MREIFCHEGVCYLDKKNVPEEVKQQMGLGGDFNNSSTEVFLNMKAPNKEKSKVIRRITRQRGKGIAQYPKTSRKKAPLKSRIKQLKTIKHIKQIGLGGKNKLQHGKGRKQPNKQIGKGRAQKGKGKIKAQKGKGKVQKGKGRPNKKGAVKARAKKTKTKRAPAKQIGFGSKKGRKKATKKKPVKKKPRKQSKRKISNG